MKKIILIVLSSVITVMPQWTAVNTGLKSLQIKGLEVVSNNLNTVTANQGLFISSNSRDVWQPHPHNSLK